MSEMQKRVVNAIDEELQEVAVYLSKATLDKIALTVFEAMRLPTDDMIQAGYDASESGLPLKKIHTAMIDAALRTE